MRIADGRVLRASVHSTVKLDLARARSHCRPDRCQFEQAARSALNSLQGAFSARVNHLVEALTHLRIYVEAAIDLRMRRSTFSLTAKLKRSSMASSPIFDAVKRNRSAPVLRLPLKHLRGDCLRPECREILVPAECAGRP
ncbi:hypothetical protein KCP78_19405 [Salmonella enterica subsp. enterica]|nr:hypothetical protein KCP78_19405 [Salmonella enterica subsp. enterica]